MTPEDPQQPSRFKPWVVPLAIASVCVIALGVISTYADLTVGALIVLVGVIGVIVVGYEASRSIDS